MQLQRLYPLLGSNKRKSTKFIVLSHISNFCVHKNPMVPDLQGFLPYYVTSKLKQYYFNQLERRVIPFHYHINMVLKDWETMVTAPLNASSNMLEECVNNGYIDSFYQDAVVIAIQDDYSVRVPDLRTFEVMAANIIAPLLSTLKLNSTTKVVWFDEIFNFDKYNYDMAENPLSNPYPYRVRPMKYFDRVQFNLETRRFA